ncbi:MAG: tRNA (guanosine(37)-N1)-methyltransferase TrmD [Alphaproteobacteria bacterium]
MSWRAVVLTLFPDMFPGPLGSSLAGRALERGDWELDVANIRSFATDKHATVDDTPFGGGAGMVMRADVLDKALEAKADPRGPVIYLSPRGKPLDQDRVKDLVAEPAITLLCGRYEGIDQRLIEERGMVEISIGDFVLSGGEPAALTLLDACVRLLPGVMGQPESLAEESFESGLLEYPHYTRPADWNGHAVPEVLLSGNHRAIAAWRRAEAEKTTQQRRPDMWARYAGRLSEATAKHHEG